MRETARRKSTLLCIAMRLCVSCADGDRREGAMLLPTGQPAKAIAQPAVQPAMLHFQLDAMQAMHATQCLHGTESIACGVLLGAPDGRDGMHVRCASVTPPALKPTCDCRWRALAACTRPTWVALYLVSSILYCV